MWEYDPNPSVTIPGLRCDRTMCSQCRRTKIPCYIDHICIKREIFIRPSHLVVALISQALHVDVGQTAKDSISEQSQTFMRASRLEGLIVARFLVDLRCCALFHRKLDVDALQVEFVQLLEGTKKLEDSLPVDFFLSNAKLFGYCTLVVVLMVVV